MTATAHILVIGTGSIGTRHANNLETLGARATPLSWRQTGLGGVTARLDSDEPDGVVIATATDIRLPLIAACAERGIPVYVEKPLAYRRTDVASIFDAAAPVLNRSLTGFMMRYHPILRALADMDLGTSFRFAFEIGHDVTQWRPNWHFSESYAARAEGGGVLLDLCHELDMAHHLLPGLTLGTVSSLGHAGFPGVDMASHCALTTPTGHGSVAMDYLAPRLVRRASFDTLSTRVEADFAASTLTVDGTTQHFEFDRNDMFLSAMGDFLALIAGQPIAGDHTPRMDRTRASCDLIAAAWEGRAFTGTTDKRLT